MSNFVFKPHIPAKISINNSFMLSGMQTLSVILMPLSKILEIIALSFCRGAPGLRAKIHADTEFSTCVDRLSYS